MKDTSSPSNESKRPHGTIGCEILAKVEAVPVSTADRLRHSIEFKDIDDDVDFIALDAAEDLPNHIPPNHTKRHEEHQ